MVVGGRGSRRGVAALVAVVGVVGGGRGVLGGWRWGWGGGGEGVAIVVLVGVSCG